MNDRLLFTLIIFLCIFKVNAQDGNEYFINLTAEVSPVISKKNIVLELYNRESEKYISTRQDKYLLASKYVELFLYKDHPEKQIPKFFDLLKLNNSKYIFIDIVCKFSLSLQFENSSPDLAMKYIDEAIKLNKGSDKYYIGHIYHAKGRFYYNENNLIEAKKYFLKALRNFKSSEKLYISSMYNNLAMIDEKLCKNTNAELHLKRGITILQGKSKRTIEESDFLHDMYGQLGYIYFQRKDFFKAEKLLKEETDYLGERKKFDFNFIDSLHKLFKTYSKLGYRKKQDEIAQFLVKNEYNFMKTLDRIELNDILQEYYLKKNHQKIKNIIGKLEILNHQYYNENQTNTKRKVNILNKEIIKSIEEKYILQLKVEKKEKIIYLIFTGLSIVVFILILTKIYKRRLETANINKKVLESKLMVHQEKMKNVYRNIHLKIESEKAILENIKNLKKNKLTNPETLLNEVCFKLKSLIHIENRNNDYMLEVNNENLRFLTNLKNKFPTLTSREVELCRYFRLGLSAKEISVLENSTDGTIRVYKAKIKTKLGLEKDENLDLFLNEI